MTKRITYILLRCRVHLQTAAYKCSDIHRLEMTSHHLSHFCTSLIDDDLLHLHTMKTAFVPISTVSAFAVAFISILTNWSIRIKFGPMVIAQDRRWWLNMRINYKSNHVGYLITQVLIVTPLAQLAQNTRLMLGMGGYSASVPKWEASAAKKGRDARACSPAVSNQP